MLQKIKFSEKDFVTTVSVLKNAGFIQPDKSVLRKIGEYIFEYQKLENIISMCVFAEHFSIKYERELDPNITSSKYRVPDSVKIEKACRNYKTIQKSSVRDLLNKGTDGLKNIQYNPIRIMDIINVGRQKMEMRHDVFKKIPTKGGSEVANEFFHIRYTFNQKLNEINNERDYLIKYMYKKEYLSNINGGALNEYALESRLENSLAWIKDTELLLNVGAMEYFQDFNVSFNYIKNFVEDNIGFSKISDEPSDELFVSLGKFTVARQYLENNMAALSSYGSIRDGYYNNNMGNCYQRFQNSISGNVIYGYNPLKPYEEELREIKELEFARNLFIHKIARPIFVECEQDKIKNNKPDFVIRRLNEITEDTINYGNIMGQHLLQEIKEEPAIYNQSFDTAVRNIAGENGITAMPQIAASLTRGM